MNLLSTLILSVLWIFQSSATPLGYFSGSQLQPESIATLVSRVKPGSVVIIGEKHDDPRAQAGQLEVMKALRAAGLTVSVGMEFISYPVQAALNGYRAGALSEADFLKQVSWGSDPFEIYRDQILFPLASEGGVTLGINAPRYLTTKIRQKGFDSLTAEERALLPPNYQGGNAGYRERFVVAAGGHLTPQTVDGYFNAQSVWDDTMAWQTAQFLAKNPNHVFVIVVGEFHVQYGGGLPDRLKARGVSSVLTLSQVDHSVYSDEELEKELIPHPKYGPRADFIWVF
tara:strand:- start:30311 stop:31165 length:855 start_codon:yes stop_codon:yes gene_type:complete